MTTFLTIFRRFPNTFRRLFKSCPKARRTFPKISEDNRRFPRKNQSCFDHTETNLRDYVIIAMGIVSLVKIARYFHVWRYHVYEWKLTWYFTGVNIINKYLAPYWLFPMNIARPRNISGDKNWDEFKSFFILRGLSFRGLHFRGLSFWGLRLQGLSFRGF